MDDVARTKTMRPAGEVVVPDHRTCIFCDSTDLSREHVWGDWLFKRFGPKESTARTSHFVSNQLPTELPVKERGKLDNAGHPLSKRYRSVCSFCNNTWMSQIENAFIPIFDKIFEISDLSLNQEETDATINWLQLKVIIQQSIRLNSPPQFKEPTRQERAAADSIHRFALERRQQFYRDRKVPHSTQFFLCRTVQKNFLPGSATYNDAIGYRGNDPILVESLSALLPGFGFWMQSNIPEENLTLKKINMCADESGKHQCFCKLDRFKSTNILPKNHKVWDYDLAKIAVEAMKELGPNMLEHL